MTIGLDFVAIPSRDPERARAFYVETLGLRPDERPLRGVGRRHVPGHLGARAGRLAVPAAKNGHLALRVDDVAGTRAELEAKGVAFTGARDTGVCHMAFFTDPDGNDLMLHHRYAPRD